MTIIRVSTSRELEDLEGQWRQLQRRAEGASVFQSFDWVRLWWKHFKTGRDLRVVFGKDDTGPVLAAPFFCEKKRIAGVPVTRLSVLGDALSPHHDFLTVGSADDILYDSITSLLQHEPDWDCLDLRRLPADGPGIRVLRRIGRERGLQFIEVPVNRYPYITVEGTFESYLRNRAGKRLRKTLRNRLNRLKKAGEVGFLDANDTDPDTLFDQLLDLSRRGWKHRAGKDPITGLPGREFFRELVRTLHGTDVLSLTALELNGRKIAFDLSFIMDDVFFAYYQIFDESLAHLSPGKVIVAHMVEEAFSRGLSEMNMSEGESDYKREWTRTTREYREAYLINGRRVRCTPLHAALRLRRGIKSSPAIMRFVHRLKGRPGNGRRKRNRRLPTR